jgi:hypothetical protein
MSVKLPRVINNWSKMNDAPCACGGGVRQKMVIILFHYICYLIPFFITSHIVIDLNVQVIYLFKIWSYLLNYLFMYMSFLTNRDIAVCIATGYGLDGRGFGIWVVARENSCPLYLVQADAGFHPASYLMCTRGSFRGGGADHSPPNSVEVKHTWIYTSTPPDVFMAYCFSS